MARGCDRHQWRHTSAILAAVLRAGGSKTATPEKLDPYTQKLAPKVKAPITILRDLFVRAS